VTDVDPLVRPLAETVVELPWLLAASIDDDEKPRGAAKTLEWIAFVFGRLTHDQRRRLVEVVTGIVAEAERGPRREFLESFSFSSGLTDENDEE
jgi:hypothetical protein